MVSSPTPLFEKTACLFLLRTMFRWVNPCFYLSTNNLRLSGSPSFCKSEIHKISFAAH